MKKTALLILLFLFHNCCYAQQEDKNIQATIIRFFDGISALNDKSIKAEVTTDFSLLENGKIWTVDSLLKAITPYQSMGLKRINSFVFITTEQHGKMAWVSYHNTADLSVKDRKMKVQWLESAVLVQDGQQWKIRLLHSTEIKPQVSSR